MGRAGREEGPHALTHILCQGLRVVLANAWAGGSSILVALYSVTLENSAFSFSLYKIEITASLED